MSIYGCGDTHMPMDIHKLNAKNFPEQKTMTKQDYVIVMGDFGLYWEDVMDKSEIYWMKWLNDRNFTTLFLDGNHENHKKLMSGYLAQDLLNTNYAFIDPSVRENYEIVYKPELRGYVGKLSDSIYHLRRGEIYTIQGKKFFVMGGAESIDRKTAIFVMKGGKKRVGRIEGLDWWREEQPNYRELVYGVNNLNKYNNKVDYILTHTAPNTIVRNYVSMIDYFSDGVNVYPRFKKCSKKEYIEKCDAVANFLDNFIDDFEFEKLYCGHFHEDLIFGKYNFLYNNVVRIV